jgi:hypothetical protein
MRRSHRRHEPPERLGIGDRGPMCLLREKAVLRLVRGRLQALEKLLENLWVVLRHI